MQTRPWVQTLRLAKGTMKLEPSDDVTTVTHTNFGPALLVETSYQASPPEDGDRCVDNLKQLGAFGTKEA